MTKTERKQIYDLELGKCPDPECGAGVGLIGYAGEEMVYKCVACGVEWHVGVIEHDQQLLIYRVMRSASKAAE